MKNNMKKYNQFVNEEVGLKNIKKIAKLHKTAEIYFHKDLDGVTSALAMKVFLKNYYQIETVDCHVIQYGGLEYAIKNHKEGNLSVLVDFAHGKPMFHIQSDHHDKQVGDEETESTYFKSARSNVEIISGEVSYSDIFTAQDIKLIQTVDSADFLANDIKPEDVQNSIFKYEKSESPQKNRFMMGFVVNRLSLAYKNKRITVKSLDGKRDHINKNILECLLLDSTSSLYSMFNNIRHYINNAKTNDKLGRLATPEEIAENLADYIDRMKDYSFVETENGDVMDLSGAELKILRSINNMAASQDEVLAKKLGLSVEDYVTYLDKLFSKNYIEEKKNVYSLTWIGRKALSAKKSSKGVNYDEEYKIIMQYAGGSMFAPGSYDRYTAFKNFPESEFFCMVWPMGLVQVSVNPFREKRLKGINLGELAKEVLADYEPMMSKYYISLESVKNVFENSQDWKKMAKEEGSGYEGVGFKFSDLEAFYKDCVYIKEGRTIVNIDINDEKIKSTMNVLHKDMTREQKDYLDTMKIPVWELIIRNSGGHPSITNISGLNFLAYNRKMLKIAYGAEKYVDVLKKIARDMVNTLKEKIDAAKAGDEVTYDTKGVELLGQDTNENYEYQLVSKDGTTKDVSKEDYVKAGAVKAMEPKSVKIDDVNKKIIAKFENFKKNNK
jgi:DNA-binding MarR family transcriptional regulator